MRKVLCSIICGVFVLGVVGVLSVHAAENVAFIDVDELFDNYSKTVELNKKLDAEVQTRQSVRDKQVEAIKKLQAELVLASDEGKAAKQAEIDAKVKELQAYDDKTRTELGEERNTYMQEILVELDEKVQAFGKSKGYDYILNGRFVLYKKDSYDITDELLKELNS